MGYYVKYGHRYIKRTRNRRLDTVDAILGNKKQAKVYGTERDAKKAITTYMYAYKELEGRCEIVPAKTRKTTESKKEDQTGSE